VAKLSNQNKKFTAEKEMCMSFHFKIKRILPIVWGLFLLFFLLLGTLVCLCLDQHREVSICTSVQVDENGKAVGYVLLSENPFGISGGNALAILLTLEISEGWCMERVTCSPHTKGMQVTVAFSEENRRATVLLDGYPTESSKNGSILTVELVREKDTHLPCGLTVSPGLYGEEAIYCRDATGEIRTVPLSFTSLDLNDPSAPQETQGLSASSDTESVCSDPLETTAAEESEGGSMQETPTASSGNTEAFESFPTDTEESKPAPHPPEDADTLLTWFVGCRETPARDGSFAVQFLFRGFTAYTPVVCFSGEKRIIIEVTEVDPQELAESDKAFFSGWDDTDHLYACTFFGLPAEGDVVFLVEERGKTVRAIYRNGIFVGYSM
jgi:hypothetical protein